MDIKTNSTANSSQMDLLLRQHPLFSRLTDDQLRRVSNCSRMRYLKEGDVLFHHGDHVDSFYFVFSGLIKLYRQSTLGQEKIFEMQGSGHIFVEALMFNEQTSYPVSAAAMKKSTVVSIRTQEFLRIIKNSPDTNMMIMTDLSRRLHELINEIENLSLHTGRNRVATYFLDQSLNKGDEFRLDIPKNAIASMLSLQPETFSRILKELCKLDVLEVKDCHIRILDQILLRKQAGII